MLQDKYSDIHPSLRASFVPLPSDPRIPLTKEQLEALFPHPEVWREMIALTLKKLAAKAAQTEGEQDPENPLEEV